MGGKYYEGYLVCLGEIQFPISPSKITMQAKGQNKTISVIDGSEINILKPAGLTEFSFDVRLPQQSYPFAYYKNGVFLGAEYYLEKLEKMKVNRKPCQFTIYRKKPGAEEIKGIDLFGTNMKVSLEDYTVKEDATEGLDILVSISVKQYAEYGTKKVKWKKKKNKYVLKPEVRRGKKIISKNTHKVKKGDTLINIARRYYKDEKEWSRIYKANKKVIEKEAKKHGRKSSSQGHYIYVGTELYLPVDFYKEELRG